MSEPRTRYFFGPTRPEVPELGELGALTVDAAVAVHWFGDLSLIRRDWPLIGRLSQWQRAAWPVPAFGTFNVLLEHRAQRRSDARHELTVINWLHRDPQGAHPAFRAVLDCATSSASDTGNTRARRA